MFLAFQKIKISSRKKEEFQTHDPFYLQNNPPILMKSKWYVENNLGKYNTYTIINYSKSKLNNVRAIYNKFWTYFNIFHKKYPILHIRTWLPLFRLFVYTTYWDTMVMFRCLNYQHKIRNVNWKQLYMFIKGRIEFQWQIDGELLDQGNYKNKSTLNCGQV